VRLLPCGDAALLVELDSLDDVMALRAHLRREPPPGTVDLVPAARALLVRISPGASLAAAEDAVRSARPAGSATRRRTSSRSPSATTGRTSTRSAG
jgi:allophanate hydrolase subunit 1